MTTKQPDWDDAPEWAQWWAIDETGWAWWYEEKPKIREKYPMWGTIEDKRSRLESMNNDATNWQQSLLQRPTKYKESK